jgi:hypothetical protein
VHFDPRLKLLFVARVVQNSTSLLHFALSIAFVCMLLAAGLRIINAILVQHGKPISIRPPYPTEPADLDSHSTCVPSYVSFLLYDFEDASSSR